MDNFSIAVNRYLREFKKTSSKQKLLIVSILLAVFLVGFLFPIWINKFSVSQPAKISISISPTPIPLPASLSITTSKKQVTLGDTFTATINIDSPNQGVEAADFVINFDPEVLKVATVSGGNYFGLYPVKTAESNNVKISGIANLVNNKFIIPVGKGTAGTIIFQAISATESTRITFDREKTIVASGGVNILDMQKIADLDMTIK